MKESRLIDMRNKVEASGRVLQRVINELENLRTLSVGMMEAIKLMPGYDEAIEQLKERAKDGKETDTSGDATGDQGTSSSDLELE